MAKNVKKRRFWLCFGIYVGILVIISGIILINVWNIMIKYENAQPENVLLEQLAKLEAGDTGLIEMPEGTKFESSELYAGIINGRFKGKKLTYKTASAKTGTMKYAIYDGDEKVGNIELSGSNERTIMAILKIYDWKVSSVTTGKVTGGQSVAVKVPLGYSVYVNGVKLSEEEQIGEPEVLDNMDYVAEYVTPPAIVSYKVSGLLSEPVVTIKDSHGEDVDLSDVEDKGNIMLTYSESEIPEDILEYVTLVAKSYSNFFSRDLPGSTVSTACIQPYFPEGSYYIELAENYRREDMWTYSAHKTPEFLNFSVTEYTRYSDDLFSVRISFDKSIYLHRTGVTRVEKTDQTYYFVNINDKWVIADMVTNINE